MKSNLVSEARISKARNVGCLIWFDVLCVNCKPITREGKITHVIVLPPSGS